MAYLKRLGIAFVVVLVLVIGISFVLPATTTVVRSTTIQAPACNVYTLLDGYAWWNDFSPWAGVDPDAVYSYEGPETGVGATMLWSSEDPNVGTGSMVVSTVTPCVTLGHDLDFGQQGTARATWTLTPTDGGVTASWDLVSEHGMNPAARYFGLLLDGMIGPDYEKGLANLKTLAEGLPTADVGALEIEESVAAAKPMAVLQSRSSTEPQAMSVALASAFGQVKSSMGAANLLPAGAPLAITLSRDADTWVFRAGIPFQGATPVGLEGDVELAETPSGSVLKVTHTGAYAGLSDTYTAVDAWLALHKRERSGPGWEAYVSDLATTPEDLLVTLIYVPL